MNHQTPAIWIISDIHLDKWLHHGWKPEEPDLKQFYDPDRQNVYLILGDTLNGIPMRESKFFAQGFLRSVVQKLSTQGDVYFVLGNHEHYSGVFGETKHRFEEFFCDIPTILVIDEAEAFLYGDTAIIVGSNWPAMKAPDYLMHKTDLAAFVDFEDGEIIPVTASDLEIKGEIHELAIIEAMDEIIDAKCAFDNLIVATHFGCAENPSQREIYPNVNPYFDPPPNKELIRLVQRYMEQTNCSVTWCYGHSHINENMESVYGGVIRTNQIGYPIEAAKLGITNPFTFKRVL